MVFLDYSIPQTQVATAAVDNGAMLFSLIGGAFMGAYPVPIKAPSVLKLDAHPAVFQFYKSMWVLIIGLLLCAVNYYILGHSSGFVLNWWAVLSALLWVPGGIATIAAVPRLGVAVTMVVNNGGASLFSFLIGWLLLGERMKLHDVYGGKVYFAPLYLFCTVLGMTALVAAPHITLVSITRKMLTSKSKPVSSALEGGGAGGGPGGYYGSTNALAQDVMPFGLPVISHDTAVGMVLAMFAGLMAGLQACAVTLGSESAEMIHGCSLKRVDGGCPAAVVESFNAFGSWTASFGIGAFSASICVILAVVASQVRQGQPADKGMAFKELSLPASLAGLLWVSAALFQMAAVLRGGATVMMPANCTATLISAGLWGLFYYKEVQDHFSAALWFAAAVFTMAAAWALSHERVN